MIRSVMSGLWVCTVTIGSVYLGASWQSGQIEDGGKSGTPIKALSQYKVKPVSVPIISDGKVEGYVVAQFVYTAEPETIKKLSIKPDAFILDTGYKRLYEGRDNFIAKPTSEAWQKLASGIKDAVNGRYGEEVLKDVLLDDFGYIPAGASRKGLDKAKTGAGEEGKKKSKH